MRSPRGAFLSGWWHADDWASPVRVRPASGLGEAGRDRALSPPSSGSWHPAVMSDLAVSTELDAAAAVLRDPSLPGAPWSEAVEAHGMRWLAAVDSGLVND
jgi:hypothetical protein